MNLITDGTCSKLMLHRGRLDVVCTCTLQPALWGALRSHCHCKFSHLGTQYVVHLDQIWVIIMSTESAGGVCRA